MPFKYALSHKCIPPQQIKTFKGIVVFQKNTETQKTQHAKIQNQIKTQPNCPLKHPGPYLPLQKQIILFLLPVQLSPNQVSRIQVYFCSQYWKYKSVHTCNRESHVLLSYRRFPKDKGQCEIISSSYIYFYYFFCLLFSLLTSLPKAYTS